MMKSCDAVFSRCVRLSLALAVIVLVQCPAARGQVDPALLVQQTPLDGGVVTPALGVHRFDLDTQVTLTAVPKAGYQFVYWIGDVADATTASTTLYIDAPKIVVAVFERVEYEILPPTIEAPAAGAAGGSGLLAAASDYANTGGGGGGGKRPQKPEWPTLPEPPEEKPDLPVPEEKVDFPVPGELPEPATAVLLGLGSLYLTVRLRRNAITQNQNKGY